MSKVKRVTIAISPEGAVSDMDDLIANSLGVKEIVNTDELSKEDVEDLILALMLIQLNSAKDPTCAETSIVPCGDKCWCYINSVSGAGLEVGLGGDNKGTASEFIQIQFSINNNSENFH